MNRIEILDYINGYFIDDSPQSKQKIIELMNYLVVDNRYKQHLDLFFMAISLTQLYGFLTYLSVDEKNYFFLSDYFTANSYSAKKLDYLNSGQLSLLNEISIHQKVFISAPTSFGKTSIINEYVLYRIADINFIIYIVPTNSLLEELYIKYMNYLSDYKNINISTQPFIKEKMKNILFLTPERFLVFFEENDLSTVDILIMDETYKIMDFNNTKISDFINTRSVRFRKVADIVGKSSCKTIFLSPFTYELSDSMKRFLEKYNISKIDRKIEYVSHDVHVVNYSKEFKTLFPSAIQKYKENDRISIKTSNLIQNLLYEKNIVYVRGYKDAYKIIDDYPIYKSIDDKRFIAFINHLNKNFSIDSHTKWKVISSLEKGIGIYISPIPRYIKREIVKLFEEDLLHTIIVTTSFTEGVNTNAKNLIFTTLQNGPKKLSSIDILNVAGRAGRFGKNSVGKIYCITTGIYDEVKKLQEEGSIKLENYNYYLDNEGEPKDGLLDFEVDMMEDEFLSAADMKKKHNLEELLLQHNLIKSDLNISLNVSNYWKLVLYDWFKKSEPENDFYYNSIINLLDDEKKADSIKIIFEAIYQCFISINAEFDVFPTETYEISAFDNSGVFTWGRLYKLFFSGTIIEVIRKNRMYIKNKYNAITKNLKSKNPDYIVNEFRKKGAYWILDKYYEKDCVTEVTDAFYTEAFRFISTVVQYKIPFYVSFFVSIFELYIKKNKTMYDFSKINIKKIIMSLEDGIIDDDNFRSLIDYGLSNDLIMKLKNNGISIESLTKGIFKQEIFDEFEKYLLDDFIKLTQ